MQLRNAEFLRKNHEEEHEKSGEKIISTPPFLNYVEATIWKAQSESELQQVVQLSHSHDKNYFAWETNRKSATPVGCLGTGYEGYLVALTTGNNLNPEEAYRYILDIGLEIWRGIRLTHKHSFAQRNALEKVIRGEASTSTAIEEWSAIFGASLARKRAEILTNRAAQEYRNRVKEKVQPLPSIRYVVGPDGLIRQEYYIAGEKATPLTTTFDTTRDEEALALITMRNIGKMGHPLLRAAMRYSGR